MIELGRHIEILLLNNDCVIVPNLGGFMTHHVEARYDDRDSMFIPPLRTLGFNPQLTMSDPLLAQSYADAYDISYPEAVALLEREVQSVKNQIEQEGQYEFIDLGILSLDKEGNYTFEPNEAGLLTPMLYGLSSIEMPLLAQVLKQAQLPGTVSYDTTPVNSAAPSLHPSFQPTLATIMSQVSPSDRQREEKTISIKVSLLRNLAVTAVAAVALLFFARPVSNDPAMVSGGEPAEASLLTTITPKKEVKEAASLATATPTVAPEATVAEPQTVAAAEEPAAAVEETAAVVEAPASKSIVDALGQLAQQIEQLNEETVLPSAGHFTVVLGCSLPLENAKFFLSSIQEKGVKKAALFEYNNDHMIVYGDYADKADAYAQLQKLLADGAVASGWIMEVK